MLSAAGALGAGAALLVVAGASPALAGEGNGRPVEVRGDYHSGTVTTRVESPGRSGSGSGASTAASGVTCRWRPDTADDAAVLGGQAGSSAANAAEQGGRFYKVSCSDGRIYLGVFVPGATAAVDAPTPASLAQEAVNRMQLPAPGVRHNPPGDALVNLATWLWLEPSQWHPLRQRTAAGPVWAEVTATPIRSVWNPGDGTPALSCNGGGTPYDTSKAPEQQSTDCSHTYTTSSAGQPQAGPDANDRFFTVTVTVYWRVSWTGPGGSGGTLPVMTRMSRFPLRVDERQALVTGGSG